MESPDNPMLATTAGEEEHIAREERLAREARQRENGMLGPAFEAWAAASSRALSGVAVDENTNAAVGAGADMARAVVAAEIYRQTGDLPVWATDERTPA